MLHYRHVNHAERYQTVPMSAEANDYSATIPAEYTETQYPIAYYFEIKDTQNAWLYPGFSANLTGSPYFVIRRMNA